MSRIRWSLALATMFALAGCGTEPAPPAPDRPETAAEALRLGLLELPPSATQLSLDYVDDSAWEELYRVSFVAPAADAKALCQTSGLGGDLPTTKLTTQEAEALGPKAEVGVGSRICGSVAPGATQWNRTVLISPGDPATVWVAIARMGR